VTPKNLFSPRISFVGLQEDEKRRSPGEGRCHAKHLMKLTYGEHPAKIWHTSCRLGIFRFWGYRDTVTDTHCDTL
jgi:hypothetical protein